MDHCRNDSDHLGASSADPSLKAEAPSKVISGNCFSALKMSGSLRGNEMNLDTLKRILFTLVGVAVVGFGILMLLMKVRRGGGFGAFWDSRP